MGQAEMVQAGPARFLDILGVVSGVPQFGRYKHLLTTESLGERRCTKMLHPKWALNQKPPFSTSSSPSRLRPWEPGPLPPPARCCTQPHSRYVCNRSLKLPAPPASPDGTMDTHSFNPRPQALRSRDQRPCSYLSGRALPGAEPDRGHPLARRQSDEGAHVSAESARKVCQVATFSSCTDLGRAGPCPPTESAAYALD